jgi:hypothetical protein
LEQANGGRNYFMGLLTASFDEKAEPEIKEETN